MPLLTRQNYIDASVDEARRIGMDSFQLKYDGWWTRCESVHGNAEMFSQTERSFRSCSFPSGLSGRVIGEFMQGTQWSQNPEHLGKFYIFDIWNLSNVPLDSLRYRDRYTLLASIKADLPEWCVLVANFPIDMFQTIWDSRVATGEFEGVVFRNQNQPIQSQILRLKRDIEDTYTCIGFVEGIGKHYGRLGALLVDRKTEDGKPATVGGGFSDDERDYIWTHQSEFIGKKFDVVGKHRFESGLLRHPNFIRWKV